MIREGATSLWERWEKLTGPGMNSHNHIMFGSVDAWFYKNLAGLELIEPGWRVFQVKPYAPEEISQVRARINTIQGEIAVSWQNQILYLPLSWKFRPAAGPGSTYPPSGQITG